MADKKSPRTPITLSPEALFRYQIISAVKARELSGQGMDAAVREVAAQQHVTLDGKQKSAAVRSIYRWLAELDRDGPSGIETERPERVISRALPQPLVDFLTKEKAEDRYASVPELIRRARERGVLGPHERPDRSSVWRACVRLGLPLRRVPAKHEADKRRFAYPHRMMMVLADGKHFRAGVSRAKRVAVFFIDDATRFVLGVVVGTDETAELFLRGLHRVLRRFGFMDILFLDCGPGFRADETAAACRRLDINLVLGTAGYPEGHGKIEKFNQTAQSQVLRGLPGAADVDADCGALELRLTHFVDHRYNRTRRSAARRRSPASRPTPARSGSPPTTPSSPAVLSSPRRARSPPTTSCRTTASPTRSRAATPAPASPSGGTCSPARCPSSTTVGSSPWRPSTWRKTPCLAAQCPRRPRPTTTSARLRLRPSSRSPATSRPSSVPTAASL